MHESMLEDVGCLLQSGEIPGIFTPEDKKEICEKMEAIDNQRDKSLQVRSVNMENIEPIIKISD